MLPFLWLKTRLRLLLGVHWSGLQQGCSCCWASSLLLCCCDDRLTMLSTAEEARVLQTVKLRHPLSSPRKFLPRIPKRDRVKPLKRPLAKFYLPRGGSVYLGNFYFIFIFCLI